jgi:hypothetical protein
MPRDKIHALDIACLVDLDLHHHAPLDSHIPPQRRINWLHLFKDEPLCNTLRNADPIRSLDRVAYN